MKKQYIAPESTLVEVDSTDICQTSNLSTQSVSSGEYEASSSEYRTSIWN